MTENEARIVFDQKSPKKQPIHIVDVPGHEKLRFRYTHFMPISKAVIFVIDSATIQKQFRSAAEYLYEVLVNPHFGKKKIPLLVVCNKSDLVMAQSAEKIRVLLETELNRLRATRTASVEGQDSDNTVAEYEYLGYDNEDFQFEHVPNE
ncbi:hypothetical protein HK102_007873, partial [Quaeritorhiza haematococci]